MPADGMVARDSLTRPDPAITLPASSASARPRHPISSRSAIEGHRRPGTSSSTCTGAAAGWPGGRRPPAAGRVDGVEPADPAPRRDRPAPARRAPPRRGVPGPRRRAARPDRACASRSATRSRRAARPAAGARSSTSSSGRPRARATTTRTRRRTGTRPRTAQASDDRTRARRGRLGAALGAPRTPPAQALPLHRLPRPAGRRRAAPRADRRGRPRTARESIHPRGHAWHLLHERFPTLDGHDQLVDQLLDLHSPRQLDGLQAILDRIDTDLRSASVEAALRLVAAPRAPARQPAERLPGPRSRTLRIHAGRVKLPAGDQWRERNPWLAFEDGYRVVRGFVQRLEGNAFGPAPARFGDDVRSLGEGVATAVVRLGTASAFRALETEAREAGRASRQPRPRVRLVVGQPPAAAQPGSAVLRLPRDGLAARSRGGRPAARSSRCSGPAAGRRGAGRPPRSAGRSRPSSRGWPATRRVVLLARGRRPGGARRGRARRRRGPASGSSAARIGEPGDEVGGIVEFIPPGGTLAPPPRTRANIGLPPHAGRGRRSRRRARPRPVRRRPSGSTAGRSRSPRPPRPSPTPRSRSSRPAASRPARSACSARSSSGWTGRACSGASSRRRRRTRPGTGRPDRPLGPPMPRRRTGRRSAATAPTWATAPPGRPRRSRPRRRSGADPRAAGPGQERTDARAHRAHRAAVVRRAATARPRRDERREPHAGRQRPGRDGPAVIRDELGRPDQKRLVGDRARALVAGRQGRRRGRRAAARRPRRVGGVQPALDRRPALGDRRSSTGSPRLFTGHDLPDEALVRACLASYRSLASHGRPPGHRRRPARAAARSTPSCSRSSPRRAIASGYRVWLSEREQTRRLGGRPLAAWLDERELNALPAARQPRGDRGGRAGRRDLVRPLARRLPLRGRVDRDAGRAGPPAPCPHPVPGQTSSGSSSSPRSGRSSSATSSSGRRCCARRSRPATGTSSRPTTSGRGRPARSSSIAELEPYIGLDPLDRAVRRADAALRRSRRPDRLTRASPRHLRPSCPRVPPAFTAGPPAATLYPVRTITRRAVRVDPTAQATTRPCVPTPASAGETERDRADT